MLLDHPDREAIAVSSSLDNSSVGSASVDYEFSVAADRVIRGTVELPPEDETPAPVVVFCHGFKGFKDWGGWPWFCRNLADRGFVVNRFNFSKSGVGPALDRHDEPEKFAVNTYGDEIEDLLAVIDRQSEWGVSPEIMRKRIGVVGHSRGGFVSLLAGAESPEIRAIATIGAMSSGRRHSPEEVDAWKSAGYAEVVNARTGEVLRLDRFILDDFEAQEERYQVARAVRVRDVPTLVVHGEADPTIPVAEAHEIVGALTHDRHRLVELPGGDHVLGSQQPFAGPNPDLNRALDECAQWFQEHLS